MQISFSAVPIPAAPLAFPVEKDGLERLPTGELDAAALGVVIGAARASRFDGEAGTTAEAFVSQGDGVRRVLLLGAGSGSESDYERAGGALTARLLTSGVESVAVDFGGIAAPTPKAVARFAAGAVQRGWRHDIYRTKLADKAKPTLRSIVLLNTPEGSEAAWSPQKAVTEGLDLTRTLVTEPPNIIYPESFVAKVLADIDGLGLEVTVLDEAAMAELGMGALLGVSQGSVRDAAAARAQMERRGRRETPRSPWSARA